MSNGRWQRLIVPLALLIPCFYFLSAPKKAFAAKTRVWGTAKTSSTTSATRPTYSVKLRSDRRALNITFNNVNTADSISYELTYFSGDLEKGVFGSILAKEGNYTTRSLLFGTCSKNVCTYHPNISGMQLKIVAKLKTGQTLTKKYRVKV